MPQVHVVLNLCVHMVKGTCECLQYIITSRWSSYVGNSICAGKLLCEKVPPNSEKNVYVLYMECRQNSFHLTRYFCSICNRGWVKWKEVWHLRSWGHSNIPLENYILIIGVKITGVKPNIRSPMLLLSHDLFSPLSLEMTVNLVEVSLNIYS